MRSRNVALSMFIKGTLWQKAMQLAELMLIIAGTAAAPKSGKLKEIYCNVWRRVCGPLARQVDSWRRPYVSWSDFVGLNSPPIATYRQSSL